MANRNHAPSVGSALDQSSQCLESLAEGGIVSGNDWGANGQRGGQPRRRNLGTTLAGLLLAALLQLAVATVAAQVAPAKAPDTPANAAQAEPDDGVREATARFFNRDIVTFRAEFLGRSPDTRARAAEENMRRVVEQRGIATVAFQQAPQGLIVLLGGQMVFAVLPGDLDHLSNQTMAQAQADIARRLGAAVNAAEREYTPRQLLNGVLLSALATVIAIVVFLLLLRVVRAIETRAHDAMDRRVAGMQHEGVRHMVSALHTLAGWALRIVFWVLALLLLEEWARFVLGQFAFTRPWAEAMTGWIATELSRWGHGIAAAITGLVAAAAILLLARLIAQTISVTFRGLQSGRFKLFGIDAELAEPTRKLVVAIVWLFAIAMAYPYLPGAQTDAFKGLSVLVGLMISLGASSIVGQAAGGFTIIYSRTMSVGDVVRVGEMEGMVQQIGLFTTRLRTVTGVEVSIPNNVVLGGQLQNLSRHPDGPGMWLETGVTIGYDTPWRQVHRLLLQAAQDTPRIQREPAPFVLQTALSDFYVEYKLRARVADAFGRALVLSELHANIQDGFNAAGVQIMSPNYEADPEAPKIVPPANWNPDQA